VARRAEEAGRLLRDVDALLAPGPGIVAIQTRLPDIGTRLTGQAEETRRRLADQPSGVALDGLINQWQAARAELATYINILAERATALERALERLAGLRETWTRARADARASRAPAPVVSRIDSVLGAIDQTRARLEEERGATLVLQDRVAQQVARCDDLLARLATARHDVAGRLLARNAVPLWRADQLAEVMIELPGRVRRVMADELSELRQFVDDHPARLSARLAILVALVLLMYAARRAAILPAPAPGPAAAPLAVLDRPLSAALLLTVLTASVSLPRPPVVQALGELLALVPALRILRPGLEPRLVPVLHGLGALLLLDVGRRLASTVPLLAQLIYLLEVLGILGLLGWQLGRQGRPDGPAGAPVWSPRLRIAAAGALVVFAGAGLAAAAGYMPLALFIGSGILGSLFVALVLYAGVKVAGALAAVGLRSRPLRGLRMVQRHRPLLEQRAGRALRWIAIAGFVILSLRHAGLWHPALGLTEAALAAELHRGSLSLSLGAVLAFAVTVAAAFGLSAIVRFVLEEEVGPRLDPGRALPYVISTLVHSALLLAGFLVGLAALGVDLTKVTILAGALGVGIGFGLQGLVNNFVSGLVVLYERRINLGDAVQIGDVAGQVQELGIRACTVRTWEGAEVIVPNASLVSEKVANWTLSDRLRRIDVAVGVAYGTPPEKVADILLGVARSHPQVVADPAPIVLFLGFGESALRFELRVWTDRFDRWLETRSELAVASYAALRDAAIEIPFPQREVRLRQD
jgi:small-conductance mechanosensitive channel